MYRPSLVAAFVCAAHWIAVGHCNTLILQPNNFDPTLGNTYAWIIPPRLNTLQEPLQHSASFVDLPSQSPTPTASGCGHPSFIRSHSHEQLNLPNEYLIAPSGAQRTSQPVFLEMDPVNCAATGNPNKDCIQQQPLTEDQTTLAAGAAMPGVQGSAAPVQPVNWPSNHGGGFGLLFFVPDSASHLPTEQLIRQQLALHRTQLPFDISMNCHDGGTGTGCLGGVGEIVPAAAATTFNGQPELVGNVNYASVPLVKNVNTSGNQREREWRTIGELLAQQQQQQHQQQLSMLPL